MIVKGTLFQIEVFYVYLICTLSILVFFTDITFILYLPIDIDSSVFGSLPKCANINPPKVS